MTHLYYLVGPPGSGKRTVGKALAQRTGAALVDNHLINDPIFTAVGADGQRPLPAAVWALTRRVREAVMDAVEQAPPGLGHIFTNYLADQPGEDRIVQELRVLAARRGVPFVPVWLECDLPELERRMPLPERLERQKLRDPGALRELLGRAGCLPAMPGAMRIDTSRISPGDAALLIAAHAGALF